MSSSPQTPIKKSSKFNNNIVSLDDTNMRSRNNRQQSSRIFVTWYKQLIDSERQNIGLYLSDDITMQWFGRTIKTRKKVFNFLKNDVEFSKHYFTSVESIDKIKVRTPPRRAKSPTCSPDIKAPKNGKRKLFEHRSCSPEWAPGCKPDDELEGTDKKRSRTEKNDFSDFEHNLQSSDDLKPINHAFGMNNKGDGVGKRRKLEHITPPNIECGQGDCMPSTSSDSNKSYEALNAQLPKLAIECNGYVEFTRTRNNHNIDSAKWERKFKLQISYSEDPLNVGEFIIWGIWYSDESKCRRNLLAAFDEVTQEVSKNV